MRLRQTHTFVELEVSREAYLEIYTLLADAGYHHAFIDGVIDMHGIALTMRGKDGELLSTPVEPEFVCDHTSWRCMCDEGRERKRRERDLREHKEKGGGR